MTDNINEMSKEEIRTYLKNKRENIHDAERAVLSKKLYDNFFSNVAIKEGSVVAGFCPIKGEVDIIPVMQELEKRGYTCVMPRMIDKDTPLEFVEWHDGIDMVEDNYKIPAPNSDKTHIPDAIIATFVAFDENMDRIGFGAGMYDKTIAAIQKQSHPVFMIGVGYEFQKVDNIPTEGTDIGMDMVITDEDVYI